MRFHLSEEQRAIQDAIRGTLADCWQLEQQHAFANGDADFDETSWNALMALGLGSILMPDSGMGLLDAALVCEVMGEAAAPGPLITQLLSVAAVARSSNDAAKLHLAGLEAGSTVAALAFCDSPYVQSARSAALFLTGSHESGIALVEAGDGVSIEAVKSTDRTRPVSKVSFDGATTHLLFPAGDPMVGKLIDAALVLIAADSLGGAQKCTDMSVAYAKEREQFGVPVGSFQAVQHGLADLPVAIDGGRLLTHKAAWALDNVTDGLLDWANNDITDGPALATMALLFAADAAVMATDRSLHYHGGYGFAEEYDIQMYYRRARGWSLILDDPTTVSLSLADRLFGSVEG